MIAVIVERDDRVFPWTPVEPLQEGDTLDGRITVQITTFRVAPAVWRVAATVLDHREPVGMVLANASTYPGCRTIGAGGIEVISATLPHQLCILLADRGDEERAAWELVRLLQLLPRHRLATRKTIRVRRHVGELPQVVAE